MAMQKKSQPGPWKHHRIRYQMGASLHGFRSPEHTVYFSIPGPSTTPGSIEISVSLTLTDRNAHRRPGE